MDPATFQYGDFKLAIVSGGRLWIDGGNMFGVVPRSLWAGHCPPDDDNRILLETNCLLVRTPDSTGLIDTGYGSKAPEKQRQRHRMAKGAPLKENLAQIGITPEQMDWVILTHLHFDHAGGATEFGEDGKPCPVFQKARHYIQRIEYEDASKNLPELAGSYFPQDFCPIEEAGLLTLVDDVHEIVPGITTQLTDGHTRGHQLVRLTSGGETVVYLGDVCPMTPHLRTFWTMAYDQFPLVTRRFKPMLFGEIVDRQYVAVFSHESELAFVRLRRDDRAKFIPEPVAPYSDDKS